MWERTAGRVIYCLLVVAMLVGLVPDVALTAALQEGNTPGGTDTGVVDAVDDGGAGFGTGEDTAFTTASVLTNDTDANGDPLSVVSIDETATRGRVSPTTTTAPSSTTRTANSPTSTTARPPPTR